MLLSRNLGIRANRATPDLLEFKRFYAVKPSTVGYKNLKVVESKDLKDASSDLRIYTKTGDKGRSALYTGERRAKNDAIFEALGTTDELSSNIGFASSCLKDPSICNLAEKLVKIQCLLQDVGSNIATPQCSTNKTKVEKTRFDVDGMFVKELENWIDEMSKDTQTYKHFILPSGGMAASSLHVARTVCRRAERSIVPIADQVDPSVLMYVNRLSDFLFVAARFVALKEGQKENIYLRYD